MPRFRFVAAVLAGSATVLLAGAAARARLPLDGWYPPIAAGLFLAMSAAAMALGEPHPFDRLGPANQVTLVRAAIVALLAALTSQPRLPVLATAAVVASVAAAVLDGVDGWLARRSRMASPFGARIDMETDALLILVVSVLVWRFGKAGVWVLAGGLMRYAFAAATWVLPWMDRPLTPTWRAKAAKVCHDVGLCVALAPIVRWPLSAWAVGATTIALGWSFAIDVRRLWRQTE